MSFEKSKCRGCMARSATLEGMRMNLRMTPMLLVINSAFTRGVLNPQPTCMVPCVAAGVFAVSYHCIRVPV